MEDLARGRSDDIYTLPVDLPPPVDDGACDHLPGARIPDEIALAATSGRSVHLARIAGTVVVFIYPRTGRPDREFVGGMAAWNAIPGARGCTPQTCAYRDQHTEFLSAGITVFGLSTQTTADQQEAADRLGLPFELLSDAELQLARRMRLPTFDYEGLRLLRRHTLVIRDGVIEHVFYPVFPPDRDAHQVLAWLTTER